MPDKLRKPNRLWLVRPKNPTYCGFEGFEEKKNRGHIPIFASGKNGRSFVEQNCSHILLTCFACHKVNAKTRWWHG
jgi:hypothetical protein